MTGKNRIVIAAAAVAAGLALLAAAPASAQVTGVPGCVNLAATPGAACVYPNLTTPTNCGAAGQPACCCVCPLGGQSGNCTLPLASVVTPLNFLGQPMFVNELPQPIFYVPDQNAYPGFDYYEIQSAPVTLSLASPLAPFSAASLSPAVGNKANLGITCPAGQVGCTPGAALTTEVWGYGQTNAPAGTFPLNNQITYPAMSFKATKGRPVKVKWVNNLPDNHLFCKNPLDSNSPCAIDRTIMGTLTRPNEQVGPFGSPMQPDNAMVVHLHGGEIPPDSDGFAELWFGNNVTAAAYKAKFPQSTMNGYTQNIEPLFLAPPGNAILSPSAAALTNLACNLLVTPQQTCPANAPVCWGNVDPVTIGSCATDVGNGTTAGDPFVRPDLLGNLIRPTGNAMIYNYPMVQNAATIWYHDHALGKTRINVAAGPAGYFYITESGGRGDLRVAGRLADAGGHELHERRESSRAPATTSRSSCRTARSTRTAASTTRTASARSPRRRPRAGTRSPRA